MKASPRDRVTAACREFGVDTVVRWCAELLAGTAAYDDAAWPSLEWIGGPHGALLLRQGNVAERSQDYWPRVWAARALLYAWCPRDAGLEAVVVSALEDPAWRVREMAAKVVRRRDLGQAGDVLAGMVGDEVARVRLAAVRALETLGEAEHAEPVRSVLDDPEAAVRHAADRALEMMSRRLERDL